MSTEHKKKEQTNFSIDLYLKRVTDFYEEKKMVINVASGAFIVVLALVLAYFLYLVPKKQQEAEIAIFKAERYFGIDSFQLALNGDGACDGLLTVIDEYGSTKSGNLAKYMAGICYLQLGQYDEAIHYLKKFRSRDKLISVQALGSIGDAYLEKNDIDNAMKYYKKAISKNPNELITPVYLYKAGLLHEMQGNWKEAISCFETLQQEYAQEAMDAEKRIAFAKTKIGK
ncbi:MAG: tetratricopeptide repeat protein [Lentimicrobiaceae bacterium]|nr:tetratricopeptide repeat protein [Lentimicrobiaceae bacterium]